MKMKLVTPALHGLIDYVFSGILLTLPAYLKLNTKATKTYQVLGTGFLVMNALTDTPVGLKRMLSFRVHQRAVAAFLAGQFVLSFHLGFLTLAITHYVLTDYGPKAQSYLDM